MSRRLLAATASLALVVSSFQPLAPHHVVTSPVFPNVRSTAAAPRVRHSTPIASSESDKVIEPSKDPAIKPGAKRAPVWSKGRSPDTNGGSNRGRGGGRGGRGGRGGGRGGGSSGRYRGGEATRMVLENPKMIVRIPRENKARRDSNARSAGSGTARRGGGAGSSGANRGGRGGGDFGRGGMVMDQPRMSPDAPARRGTGGPGGKKGAGGRDRDSARTGKPGSKYGLGEKRRGGARRFEVAAESSGRGSLRRKRGRKGGKNKSDEEKVVVKKSIVLEEGSVIQVQELAERLEAKGGEVVKYLMMDMGIMATLTQSIDQPTAKTVAEAFGYSVNGGEDEDAEDEDDGEYEDEDEDEDFDASGAAASEVMAAGAALFHDDEATLTKRAPVVTIMGHVDHGKTSLLDAIRQADVVSGEAGGITQHVGAYQVKTESGEPITFIDTPGHAAFSEMRQRGADATDIVVLVVAADDGVKDQTSDSLAAAKQAGKPVIVAFNKIDKEGADVARVAAELTNEDLLIESLGGDVLSAEISAKQKIGLEDLLDKILLQAEVLDLKANAEAPASGTIIEAKVEKGVGTVATTLIQRGTLRVGDPFVAGEAYGKVRTLVTDKGERIQEAGPATPVAVTGLDGVPAAGDLLLVGDDTAILRQLALSRAKISREQSAAQFDKDLRKSITDMMKDGGTMKEIREVNVLIKADVQGSAEALSTALRNLVKEDEICQVKVKVLQSGVGDVTKSDVAIAGVSNAWVIGFNVAANFQAMEEARMRGIEIGYYSIVYECLEEMEERMQKVLSPTPDGELVGKAEVKAIFDIGKVGKVAGCMVTEGEVVKGSNVRVLRGPRIVHEGKLRTLKSFKEDVQTVASGNECGINFFEWEDMQEEDTIECYVE